MGSATVDLSLSGEQRQLVDSFAAMYARESTSERVRAAEPSGFDPRLWKALLETGVVEMAVDEAAGGWGASELELALIAEQFGRAVASAPVIEAQVAARLLADAEVRVRDCWLKSLAGGKLVGFAPRAQVGALAGAGPGRSRRGRGRRVGRRAPPGGAYRGQPSGQSRISVRCRWRTSRSVTTSSCSPKVTHARRLFSDALDLWLTLTAAALAGAAKRAVEMGVDYAKQRHAFGTPIGTFQAVSHPLADSATAVDGARLLALKAACAFVDQPHRASELAAMAFAFAYETARDATHRSLHIHGGYGFGMEGDIQLYYRRVRGWAMVYGEPAVALDRVADARYGAVAG